MRKPTEQILGVFTSKSFVFDGTQLFKIAGFFRVKADTWTIKTNDTRKKTLNMVIRILNEIQATKHKKNRRVQ